MAKCRAHLPLFNCIFHEFHGALHDFRSNCQINFTNTTSSKKTHRTKTGPGGRISSSNKGSRVVSEMHNLPQSSGSPFLKSQQPRVNSYNNQDFSETKKKCPKIEIWRMILFEIVWFSRFFPPKKRLEAKPIKHRSNICQQPDLPGAPGIFLPSSFGMANVAHTNPAAGRHTGWCRMIRAGLMKTIGFPQ